MLLLSSPTFPTSLAACAYAHVKVGMRVLDLGAGVGRHAKMFRGQGGIVTAVDRDFGREWGNMTEEPREGLSDIEWHAVRIETFIKQCPDERMFDFIFIQNLIHFLPKDWVLNVLLPWVNAHTAPGGLVAIRTFTADPIPPYPMPLSHYTPADLKAAFADWEKVVSETMEQETNGHYFFFVDRAARRPLL